MNPIKLNIQEYSFPTKIIFGEGAVKLVPVKLKELGFKRPLLVTDIGVVESPFFKRLRKELLENGLEASVFYKILSNPMLSQVMAGVEVYHEWNADCVIAVGGGASMDVAKAILVLVSHKGHLFDYEDGAKDALPIDQPLPYFAAVPTTAGTGSEVGRSAVISDDQTKIKKIIFSPSLLPKIVFADPKLLITLPPHLTAGTGLDALTHCIEAYLAKGFHPICDGIALEGIRLISQSLVPCMKFARRGHYKNMSEDTEHIFYRGLMLNASMMGAIAFQKGLGWNHSCAHALSTVYNLHHGLANGVMLPFCMEFNAETVPEKFTIMAQAAGLSDESPQGFIHWLQELKQELSIPEKLSELLSDIHKLNPDIKKEDLIDIAFQDVCHALNPREVKKDDFIDVFSKAF